MFLSVVIATYNRSEYLLDSLESWKHQSFPAEEFEMIIVDNGSTDRTKEVVEDFIRHNTRLQLRYVSLEKPCLSCARNKGIELARGDYIAFVDDDASPEKDYISKLKKYTENYADTEAFGGKVLPKYEGGKEPGWISPYLQRIFSLVDLGDNPKEFKEKYPVGCNMIFKRSIFDKIGVFDVPPGLRSEDKHFFIKVKKAGIKVMYLPEVVVYHFIDNWRLTSDYVKKTSCNNGFSDYVMLGLFQDKTWLRIKRFADLMFKVAASLILWLKFWLEGNAEKGKYLFLSMWHTMKCFTLKKNLYES